MYELDKAAFGHFLAQLRREKGMTQKELAATLYVSDKAVSKWERGLSVPDISLLVPLAEQLNVTVAELLQGRRVEEERRFTREETEDLIRKALTFSAEPPERRQARTKKYLPVYVICCVLGVAEALAVWAAGLADIEGALALLIIGVVFGVVYGAYTMFWMAETLPRYYDENRICNFAQGAFHIHIPGIYYNNRNWKHVLRAFRVWSMASMVLVPPQTVARAFCRASIGQVSHLPVLRLAPVKEERNNCPFLTENHCAIHDAEPLVCALYPLAQEISRAGEVSYFLQPTGCGGRVIEAKVEDYLARYDVPAREKTDVRWAQTCMDLEDVVEPLDAALEPPLRRRMQAKLWQALYFKFDYEKEYLPQLEENLVWLGAELQKLTDYQQRRNTYRKK